MSHDLRTYNIIYDNNFDMINDTSYDMRFRDQLLSRPKAGKKASNNNNKTL